MIYTRFCILNSFTRFLGQDCIIRGIPLRVDYINKAFWAYISIRIFVMDYGNQWWNVLLLLTMIDEEIFQNEPILTLQGR